MKNIISFIASTLKKGENAAMAMIITSDGSAPRGAGAAMAIDSSGNISGTIGGGAVEYRVQQMAAELIKKEESSLESFRLRPDDIRNLGMVCGGDIDVYIQFIKSTGENLDLYEKTLAVMDQKKDAWLINILCDGQCRTALAGEEGIIAGDVTAAEYAGRGKERSETIFEGEKIIYLQPVARKSRTYIFGGGHVSRALVPVISNVGFECVVFDNMEQFSRKEDFIGAREAICGEFEELERYLSVGEDDFVVIMTRGHEKDYQVLKQVLSRECRYIGMIGSRSKVAHTRERLLADGFTEADIAKVNSPIGLSIKAETPEEIAVSIAAEMILVRRTKQQ